MKKKRLSKLLKFDYPYFPGEEATKSLKEELKNEQISEEEWRLLLLYYSNVQHYINVNGNVVIEMSQENKDSSLWKILGILARHSYAALVYGDKKRIQNIVYKDKKNPFEGLILAFLTLEKAKEFCADHEMGGMPPLFIGDWEVDGVKMYPVIVKDLI